MSRPRVNDDRVSTTLRIERPLLDAVDAAAEERGVGRNLLLTRLVADGLARLVPVDEALSVRPAAPVPSPESETTDA